MAHLEIHAGLVSTFIAALIIVLVLLAIFLHSLASRFFAALEAGRAQTQALAWEINKARAAFGPTQSVPCKHCNGTGKKVRDNPLVAAIAKTIERGVGE